MAYSHKYVNSLNDMEIRVQSVTGCMGGPETEVELGRRGVAGSVMTPRMHQLNGRRRFIIFHMQISRHLSHFHLQLNQLQDMVKRQRIYSLREASM